MRYRTEEDRDREHEIKETKNDIMSSRYIELLEINKKKAINRKMDKIN